MTSARSPACSTAPGAARSGRLLTNVTLTSPRRPCGAPDAADLERRPARAPRSLRDVDVGLHAVGAACGTHELAQRLDHTTATADETAHVVGVRVHEQRDLAAATLLDLDLDRVGIVGEVAGDVLGDGAGARADDAVALRRRLSSS